jgi:hypothetical protein
VGYVEVLSFTRTLWYNLHVMKFHGIFTLSVVVAALASCADAGELAHDAASLARALTAQDGAGLKFDFSAVVTYVCTNNFDRRINIAAEDASGSALVCTSDDVRPAVLPMPGDTARFTGEVRENVYGRNFAVLDSYELASHGKAPTPKELTHDEMLNASCYYKLEDIPSNTVYAVERVGSISLTKYNSDGKEKLSGVTFELSKSDGTVVDSLVTDENGQVVFSLLPAGDYVVTETNTLNGYELLAQPINVTIPLRMSSAEVQEKSADTTAAYYDDGRDEWRFYDLSYEVRNGQVYDLPLTGSKPSLWPVCLGIALAAAGTVLVKKTMSKSNTSGLDEAEDSN